MDQQLVLPSPNEMANAVVSLKGHTLFIPDQLFM